MSLLKEVLVSLWFLFRNNAGGGLNIITRIEEFQLLNQCLGECG